MNLVTLGLMCVRKVVTDPRTSAPHEFLSKCAWLMHNVHDVQDGRLVAAEEYGRVWDDVAELWFLSMQGGVSVKWLKYLQRILL